MVVYDGYLPKMPHFVSKERRPTQAEWRAQNAAVPEGNLDKNREKIVTGQDRLTFG